MRQISKFQWLYVLVICSLIVFIVKAISLYIEINRLKIEPEHFIETASFWMFWAIHAPLVFILSRRFSFQRSHLAKSLLIYLSAGTAWAMFIQGLPVVLLLIFKDFIGFDNTKFHLLSDWAIMFLPNLLIFWLILSLSLISLYFQRYQIEMLKASKLDVQLSNARLQSLKMQLQPHFLFNTLHSISALVLKNENRDAVKMINRLSELLRLSLDNIETQIVSLEDEIEFTRRYLEIELIRFKDRLEVEWEIDANAINAEVPNLILQPLVENAMRHAVDLNSGTSRIKISADLKDKQIWLKVSDDGKNVEKIAAQNDAYGLGLKNTRARLAELYGEDFRFDLSRKEDWTTAQIVIPFSPVKENSEGENI